MRPSTHFPVAKSFLSTDALSRSIESAYGLADVRCQLITASLRDVYQVSSGDERYVLFIYRHGHRSLEEIESEWRFVRYLYDNHLPVAPAIPTQAGDLILTFDAPEGSRYGILTHYAPGDHLRHRPSPTAVRTFGELTARIHTLADLMPFPLVRPPNDIDLLLPRFLAALERELPDREEDLAYLHACTPLLLSTVASLPKSKPCYGIIHGDIIRANAQVADDGGVTVLDFDLCGPGWRTYDVASYLLVIRGSPNEAQFERAFLDGYEGVRPLTPMEQESLPFFEAVRAVFSLGIPAMNAYHWGAAYLRACLDVELGRLRQAMARLTH